MFFWFHFYRSVYCCMFCRLFLNFVSYVFSLLCLCIFIVMFMYFYCYVYVFLLLCLCIFIVMFMYFYCYVYVFLLLRLCIFIVMFMYFYFYIYVFLLLCMFCSVYSVFIVPTGTLRLPWLRFFRGFSSVVRQMAGYNSQRRGTVRTLPS
jgi:hypothetical protein